MRRFLANVLYLFLGLPLALSALMLISVRPWALDRETYKRFVEDDRLYAALQAPEIAARAPRTIVLGTSSFDGSALTAAAQKNLPYAEIKSTASRAIDAALDDVEGKSPAAIGAPRGRVELDLRPLKAALKSSSPGIARDYVATLAANSGGANGNHASDSGGTDATLRPKPGATQGEVPATLTAAISTLPDRAVSQPSSSPRLRTIGGPMGIVSRGPGFGLGDRDLSQALLNRMTATTTAIAALLLAGLGALGGSGALSRLSRSGKYLMVPSIVVLAVGVFLAIPGGLILQNVLPHELRVMFGGSGGAQLRAYLASALGPIARSFFITGLAGASIGGVLAQAKRITEPKELD